MPNFNNGVKSPLLEREEYQGLASSLIRRTPIFLCSDSNSFDGGNSNALSPLDNFLKSAVDHWEYVYCVASARTPLFTEMRFGGALGFTPNQSGTMGSTTGIVCFAYPIYRNSSNISMANGTGIAIATDEINAQGLPQFFRLWTSGNFWSRIAINDGISNAFPQSSDIIAVKISIKPPFNFCQFTQRSLFTNVVRSQSPQYLINNQGLHLFVPWSGPAASEFPYTQSGGRVIGNSGSLLYVYRQVLDPTHFSEPYTISKQINFNNAQIRSGSNSTDQNPKLLGADFYQLRLESADGQYFEYDAQKLNMRTFRLAYTEVPTPDITRGYLRILTDANSVYAPETINNFTGLVYSSDNSMIFSSTAWSDFISNNKNFFQMAQMQKDFSDRKLLEGNRSGVMGGIFGYGINNAAMQRAEAGNVGVGGRIAEALPIGSRANSARLGLEGNALAYQKKMLSADNVRAAPNNVQNASGNAYFINFITDQQLYISEYEALPHELALANEDMHLNGFTFGRIGQVLDHMQTRNAFNFVQAEIQNMSGVPMSNEIREDIKRRFAEGIRFWHGDAIDYTIQNFERRIT